MFKVGDKVRINVIYYNPEYVGLVGEVIDIENSSIGCFFPVLKNRGRGHNLGGLIAEARGGWWIESNYLELVPKEPLQWPPKGPRKAKYEGIPLTILPQGA